MDDRYKTGSAAFDAAFEFLTGDVGWEDYGGNWYRRIDDTRFHVVRIFNWIEEVGEYEAPDETYHVDLVEIDTGDEDGAKSAVESWGLHFDEDGSILDPNGTIIADIQDEDTWRLVVCDAMAGYGAKAYLEQWNGDDLVELFDAAAAESNLMATDEEAYEERMESPGNALGSTRREMARGDITSAVIRGIARGDEGARIIGIMHYGREGVDEIEKLVKSGVD